MDAGRIKKFFYGFKPCFSKRVFAVPLPAKVFSTVFFYEAARQRGVK
jgi:hypothetical protein